MLQRRLTVAAHKVCGPSPDLRSPMLRAYQACVSDAVARATAQTGQLRLADAAR